MSEYIVEDIFKDINPDDLMDDSDDTYEEDYSDGISRNPAKDGKYKYGICFWSKSDEAVYISDMMKYLIEMFEEHSGNVGTYSDISVRYRAFANLDKIEYDAKVMLSDECVGKQVREEYNDERLQHCYISFKFNLHNPRRFITGLCRILSRCRERFFEMNSIYNFQIYLLHNDHIYGLYTGERFMIRAYPEIDAVIGNDKGYNSLLSREGVLNPADAGLFVNFEYGGVQIVELGDRKCAALNYNNTCCELIYLNKNRKYEKKRIGGNYKMPVFKNSDIEDEEHKYIIMKKNSRSHNYYFLVDENLNVIPIYSQCISFAKSKSSRGGNISGYFVFWSYGNGKRKTDIETYCVNVVDYKTGEILDESMFDIDMKNNILTVKNKKFKISMNLEHNESIYSRRHI